MAGRFLVTGVQLGMLKTLAKFDRTTFEDLIDEILNNQCVGLSKNSIQEDVEKIKGDFSEE